MTTALDYATEYARNNKGECIEACSVQDPDLMFYADDVAATQGVGHPAVQEAKAVCRTCAFRDVCLSGAFERNEQYGIWGALTTNERRAMDRRRRRAGHQPEGLFVV